MVEIGDRVMDKYTKLIEKSIKLLGGKDNIAVVNHCATRLRLTLNKPSLANEEQLKSIPGIMGVVKREKEIQLIIGTEVGNVYNEFIKYGNFNEGGKINEKLDSTSNLEAGNEGKQENTVKKF